MGVAQAVLPCGRDRLPHREVAPLHSRSLPFPSGHAVFHGPDGPCLPFARPSAGADRAADQKTTEVSPVELLIEPAYDHLDEVVRLFTEYTRSIRAQSPDVARCLSAQHYDAELRELAQKYGPPDGRLYLARLDGESVGCVALRRLDREICEMKRLYVRPGHRGLRVGARLVERIIGDARALGYRHMRLDTFPFMEEALRLYHRYGFRPIPRYNDNPVPTAVFLQLDL